MKTRRILSVILSVSLLLSACSGRKNSNVSAAATESAAVSTEVSTEADAAISKKETLRQDISMSTAMLTSNSLDESTVSSEDTLLNNTDNTVTLKEDAEDKTKEQDETEIIHELNFNGLGDPALRQYVEDYLYADLASQFSSDDYKIEDINVIYYSKEYLDELAYNSKTNIYFGYSLAEIEEQFKGEKYIFTLGEDGKTIVKAFEGYDDTYDQVIKNVATGTGVILICVSVSAVAAAAGAPVVSLVFACSATTAESFALSSGLISGVSAGVVTGIQTKDFKKALDAAALKGSQGFKWGAISGAVVGGVSSSLLIRDYLNTPVSDNIYYGSEVGIPTPRQSELSALDRFGGEEQVTFLQGQEVPYGTPGATRPDIIRETGGHLEAIEVKNYNLELYRNQLCTELKRQIGQRTLDLPDDATQMVVLDVRGRGYTEEFLEETIKFIKDSCSQVYADLPIEIIM